MVQVRETDIMIAHAEARGYNARNRGRALESNPFKVTVRPLLYEAWVKGWSEADENAKTALS